MSRILIGSSNVYRNYKASNYTHKEYTMVRCMDLENLDAQLTNLEPNETEVVISVLENVLDKAGKGTPAHVASYSSRPILHVKTMRAGSSEVTSRAFTFVDAVIRYGSVLAQEDLEEAYKKAGSAFKGQLEQHFVVLREGYNPPPSYGGRSGAGGGGGAGATAEPRKRPRTEDPGLGGSSQADKRPKSNK